MKRLPIWASLLLSSTVCAAQNQPPLCPKHIEDPSYPAVARFAHTSAKVVLAVTIDGAGKVSDAKLADGSGVLADLAMRNIRTWTFEKPPSTPYVERITYDFQLDDKLPLEGVDGYPFVTYVTYDLPDRVTIRGNNPVIETSESSKNTKQ
jgi:TonB family protein